MRRCISEPTTRFPRPAPRSVATSASTTPSALIRALTGKRQTMLTSVACSRSRQPEPGRGATYLNRNAVQTNRATADEPYISTAKLKERGFRRGDNFQRSGTEVKGELLKALEECCKHELDVDLSKLCGSSYTAP